MDDKDRFLTTKEAGEIAGLTSKYIRDLIAKGDLKGRKINGGGRNKRYRVLKSDLLKFLGE